MHFIKYLTNKMINYHVIDANDIAIYTYGLVYGFIIIANILTTLIFSYLIKELNTAIIMLLAFIPLRSFSGGLHCKTKAACYIISNTIIIILLKIHNYFIKMPLFILSLALLSGLYISLKKVTNSDNRTLDKLECLHYGKIKRKLIILLFLTIAVLLSIHRLDYATVIMCSIILVAILLILDEIKTHINFIFKIR